MPKSDLDRLLVTMDVTVRNFAVCEVQRGKRLIGAAVDAIMIHYVLAGTMFLETADGQPAIVCKAGSLVLIPPGIAPRMAPQPGPAQDVHGLEHVAVERDGLLVMDAAAGGAGDLRFVAGIILATHSGSFGLLDRLRLPVVENLSDDALVRLAYAALLDEISRPQLGGAGLTAALMKACLVLVLRRYLSRPEGATLLGAIAEPRLSAALAAVLERPAATHSLNSLAALSNLSRSQFSELFAERMGTSPMDFVIRTRLHHAAQLLRDSRLPVKVVAASVGWASRSHFSRAFAKAYGLDPTTFRARFEQAALDAPSPPDGSV